LNLVEQLAADDRLLHPIVESFLPAELAGVKGILEEISTLLREIAEDEPDILKPSLRQRW
jgi:hypothetical protein